MEDAGLPDAPPVMRRILPSSGWSMEVMLDPLAMAMYVFLGYAVILSAM